MQYFRTIGIQFVSLISVLLLVGMLSTTTATAQGIGVMVQPSTIEERLDPGDSVSGVLTVTNEESGEQTYYLGTRNIESMDLNGRPQFADEIFDDPMQAAAWIVPLRNSVTLEKGESATMPYSIVIPEDASPGSHFAAIFVNREAEVTTTTGAGVGFNVGSLVHIRVNGDVLDDMLLREFFSDASFYTEPGVEFTTRVENTGTIFQRPQGLITITDMLGKEVAQLGVNEQAGGIMQRNERIFKNEWVSENFTLGKYTATIDMVFGDEQHETVTRALSFWVVPVKQVGVVVGALVVLILLLVVALRAYVRRELRRAGKSPEAKQAPAQVTFVRRMMKTLVRVVIILVLAFIVMLIFFQ